MRSHDAKVLFCGCSHSNAVPDETRRSVYAALAASGMEFEAVDDLCRLAAERDGLLARMAAEDDLVVIACRPRVVRWLFAAAGEALNGSGERLLGMREMSAGEIIEEVLGPEAQAELAGPLPEPCGSWVPWFPVIDYDRCANCKQCLSFCLFGVYETGSGGRVEVANPANCKTNCPACARICPEVAIVFPKYADGPISGAPVKDEELERAKVKVNIKEMLGDNVYAALAERRKLRRQRLVDATKLERLEKSSKASQHGDEDGERE